MLRTVLKVLHPVHGFGCAAAALGHMRLVCALAELSADTVLFLVIMAVSVVCHADTTGAVLGTPAVQHSLLEATCPFSSSFQTR